MSDDGYTSGINGSFKELVHKFDEFVKTIDGSKYDLTDIEVTINGIPLDEARKDKK